MLELILIRGYPGVGKTTFSKALAKQTGYTFIDHNDILNTITKYTIDDSQIYQEIHRLELAMAKKLLADGKSVIVARGFSKTNSLMPYIECARLSGAENRVVTLKAPITVLRERLRAPSRDADFKPIQSAADLDVWLSNNPLEEYAGETIIDSTLPTESMLVKIRKA